MPPGRRRGGVDIAVQVATRGARRYRLLYTMPTSRNRNRGTHAYRAASTDSNVSTVNPRGEHFVHSDWDIYTDDYDAKPHSNEMRDHERRGYRERELELEYAGSVSKSFAA